MWRRMSALPGSVISRPNSSNTQRLCVRLSFQWLLTSSAADASMHRTNWSNLGLFPAATVLRCLRKVERVQDFGGARPGPCARRRDVQGIADAARGSRREYRSLPHLLWPHARVSAQSQRQRSVGPDVYVHENRTSVQMLDSLLLDADQPTRIDRDERRWCQNRTCRSILGLPPILLHSVR